MAHPTQLILETNRLYIRPLSYDHLVQYTDLDNSLENSLGLEPYPRSLPGELKEALEQAILPMVKQAGDDLLYCTLWTIIEKEHNRMVGDLCFKGAPNAAGEIEIGYGTYADFQGRGFMTEAIGRILQWAFNQPGVQAVIAETDKGNIASHQTLKKNGFEVYKEEGEMIWWRLRK
ncbi:GNAT family N-acetyltransferase [Flavihumibacter rivuli]|uniref:GNAT family N-acetyltransferase n=1 Tax=Flavihumibacter rivuli TaxID=2838156 RepID=UPI001BDE4263|nr:GNAT family N-acetyltransferase [Flavihumibacter rivuli]ULQ54902.1 GNAT family N-acetyltransferase [Flavihumibacter rivuli]